MITSPQQASKEAILQYLLKENRASVQAIAKAMRISPQGIRRHLKDLHEQGLVEYEIVHNKTGRPLHLYYLSRQGRDLFPQNYGEFAVSFLETLTETVGEKAVSQVLAKQWQKKAENYRRLLTGKSLTEKLNQLVEIRRKEGYMAELFLLRDNPPQFFISEHNCAIAEVAESYPQVCSHELEMFASLFPDCKVERTSWINEGQHHCGYLIAYRED